MAEISIVIPCYNVEKYLKECLDSVFNQTFKDFEVIAVNDGSSDKTPDILKAYAKKHPNLKIVSQKNQGISQARNNGLKKASGKYIYFLDSDDLIHPQLLEITHYFALQYNVDMVSFEFYKLRNEQIPIVTIDKKKIKHFVCNKPLFLGIKKRGKRISFNVWSKLYKRELLDNLSFISHINYEDYPHTFAILAKHPKTVILDKELHFYRINMNSISHQKVYPKQIKDYATGLRFLYDIYKAPHLKEELSFLKRTLIPTVLKEQLNRCKLATDDIKDEMFTFFSEELKELDQKGLISFCGNGLIKYLTYKRLIKGEKL